MPPTPAAPLSLSLSEWLTWISRALILGLVSAALAGARWGITIDTRVHDAEMQHIDMVQRITKLEAAGDGIAQLRTDIAVIKAQLEAQQEQNGRIEMLLEKLSRP